MKPVANVQSYGVPAWAAAGGHSLFSTCFGLFSADLLVFGALLGIGWV